MGVPVPPPLIVDPVSPGDLCASCWGVGKTFGDTPTPESVTVNFSGISKGPIWTPDFGEPPDGDFIIPQNEVISCFFRLRIGDILYVVIWNDVVTFVQKEDLGFGEQYTAAGKNACDLFCTTVERGHFIGGSALIILPEVT